MTEPVQSAQVPELTCADCGGSLRLAHNEVADYPRTQHTPRLAARATPAPDGLRDKGIAFGFQEAADVAREMGSDEIADALRAEGIKRYAALPGLLDRQSIAHEHMVFGDPPRCEFCGAIPATAPDGLDRLRREGQPGLWCPTCGDRLDPIPDEDGAL